MVDNNNIDFDDNNIFEDEDKKIILKFFKEKKTSRTYIYGLHDFMTDEEVVKFVMYLKKKLGTGIIKKENDGIIEYGFQGDHKERIKKILISDTSIPEEKIKI